MVLILYSGHALEMAAGGQEETLRLEGFAESLRGARTYCIASDAKEAEALLKGRLAGIDGEVAHRGRRVLVVQGAAVAPKWLVRLCAWDATFHVREVSDLRMALTYLRHAVKPVRVVWAGVEPGASTMAALGGTEGLTVLGIGERAPSTADWHVLMWGPSTEVEGVEPALLARMGSGAVGGLRAVVKELRASGVGLVWSSIGESDKRGGLYWVDPGEGVEVEPLDVREAAETLRSVAEMLAGGGIGGRGGGGGGGGGAGSILKRNFVL